MSFRYSLEIITIIAIGVFCAVFIYTSSSLPGAGFSGTDTAGSELVADLSGQPVEHFKPLIPQWQPPGAEIESSLFALQAAIGGILAGGVLGYWLGQKKKT
jgi:cobalt/nickel transport protein